MSFVSKLRQILEEYSPKQAEAQTVDEALQFLKARGVKDAELQFSGFDRAMQDFGDAFTLEDMLEMEGRRPDLFSLAERDPGDLQYGGIRLGSKDPKNVSDFDLQDENYREWAYQFMNHPWQDEPAYSRSASHHFEEIPSYLGHVRTTDDVIDGNPVLNIQELQSDVLGTKKSLSGGHGISLEMDEVDTIQDLLAQQIGHGRNVTDAGDSDLRTIAPDIQDATGYDIRTFDNDQLRNFFDDGFTPVGSGLIPDNAAKGPGPMDFPNKKNYYQRMVERMLGVAEDEGKDIISPLTSADEANKPLEPLYRGEHIQKTVYDPIKGQVPKALKKVAREQDMEYDTFDKDGVTFGRIKRGGKKKKPTELYSMGGLLTPAIMNQILQDPSQDVR